MDRCDSYSVLMSVYWKEKPGNLIESLDSLIVQSLPPLQIVLVCDGPLSAELDNVISEYVERFPNVMHIVRLPCNSGLGIALNEGLKECDCEYVARMDSDDIALPTRCEKQLAEMKRRNLDIVSCNIKEFSGSKDCVTGIREVPISRDDIYEYAKSRSPFNHPAVMFRKSAVEAAGGYIHLYLAEDYYLWARMLVNGVNAWNVSECLLFMRMNDASYARRGGIKLARSYRTVYTYLLRHQLMNKGEWLKSNVQRYTVCLAPKSIRKMAYNLFGRRRPSSS